VSGLALSIASLILLPCFGAFTVVIAIPGAIVCYQRASKRSTDRHEAEGRLLARIGLVISVVVIAISVTILIGAVLWLALPA
jgi:hypothetical protein